MPLSVTKCMVVNLHNIPNVYKLSKKKIMLQSFHGVTSVATRSKLSVSMWSPPCLPSVCPKVHV